MAVVVAGALAGGPARGEDAAGRFVATASLQIARNGARAVTVEGEVLVVGGENDLEGPLRSAELWSDGKGKAPGHWTPAGRMQVPRVGHTVTALGDGRVLVVGGGGHDPQARLAELWGEGDVDPQTFKPAGRLSVSRHFHTATLLGDGRVLVIGGRDPHERPLATAEIWDPKRRAWTAAGRLHLARCCHTATLLANGRVLVVGGRVMSNDPYDCEDVKGPCTTTTDAVELWDPRTRRFTDGPALATGGDLPDFSDRAAHTATPLPDGRVLIMGGAGNIEPDPVFPRRPTAYLWDPAARRWTQIQGAARDYHTATLLADGRVLIVGGALNVCGCCKTAPHDGPVHYVNDALLWSPVTGKLVNAGNTARSHMNHAAALLPDGRVLIAGGTAPEWDEGAGEATAVAELWLPVKGSP